MIECLSQIEAGLKEALIDQTSAGDQVYTNLIHALQPDDYGQMLIVINFQDAVIQQEHKLTTQFVTGTYSISCICYERGNGQEAYDLAKNLAREVQTLLRGKPDDPQRRYTDLQLTGLRPIRDTEQSLPVIGFVLTYSASAMA